MNHPPPRGGTPPLLKLIILPGCECNLLQLAQENIKLYKKEQKCEENNSKILYHFNKE